VAHLALVTVVKKVFDGHMPRSNQIEFNHGYAGSSVTEDDLLRLHDIRHGEAVTSQGLSRGVGIVLAYTEVWLRGVGCIPRHNTMEDAATAETSRAQIWQWRSHGVSMQDDGQVISAERVAGLVEDEVDHQCAGPGQFKGKWRLTGSLVESMLNKEELDDFLTSVCYPRACVARTLPS
jgi:malate synthase